MTILVFSGFRANIDKVPKNPVYRALDTRKDRGSVCGAMIHEVISHFNYYILGFT